MRLESAVPTRPFSRWTAGRQLQRSTDGGATWEPLGTPASFGPRLLVAGRVPVIYGAINGEAGRYVLSATPVVG